MRILLQRNIKNLVNSCKKISFKLFWYEGYPIVYPIEHLRSLPNNIREVNSDVFIFESSNQIEQYVLVIINCDNDKTSEEDYFSLDVFSFIDVNVSLLPSREILNSMTIADKWCKKGRLAGDIHSPYFPNNPQYILTLDHTTHIQIKLLCPNYHISILLIENGLPIFRIPYDYVLSGKSPGFFNQGFSYFECVLDAGEYSIVCVSKTETFIEDFTLQVSVVKDSQYPLGNQAILKLRRLEIGTFHYVENLQGEWNKENSVSYDYQNIVEIWSKLAGYCFFLEEKTRMQFNLRPLRSKNMDTANVSLSIFKVINEKKVEIVLDDNNLPSSSPWGYFSKEVVLEPNSKGYIVICNNFNKSFTGFELEINSDCRLRKVVSNFSFPSKRVKSELRGRWRETLSGGSPLENTFTNNPKYSIVSPYQNCNVSVELSTKEKFKVGLLLVRQDLIQQPISLNGQVLLKEGSNSVIDILSQGVIYTIIPFTEKPNQIGDYIITIHSNEVLEVKEAF